MIFINHHTIRLHGGDKGQNIHCSTVHTLLGRPRKHAHSEVALIHHEKTASPQLANSNDFFAF